MSIWYHATTVSAAIAILGQGFRNDTRQSLGRWHGQGVYCGDSVERVARWVSMLGDTVVIACHLAPGTTLVDVAADDRAMRAELVHRYGREILGPNPWSVIPSSRHLSHRAWAALYHHAWNQHVSMPGRRYEMERRAWNGALSRMRKCLRNAGIGGLVHGHDQVRLSAADEGRDVVVADPARVIPLSVHRIERADGLPWGPEGVSEAHPMRLGPVLDRSALQAILAGDTMAPSLAVMVWYERLWAAQSGKGVTAATLGVLIDGLRAIHAEGHQGVWAEAVDQVIGLIVHWAHTYGVAATARRLRPIFATSDTADPTLRALAYALRAHWHSEEASQRRDRSFKQLDLHRARAALGPFATIPLESHHGL